MSRNLSVDIVRVLAILGVISIHTKPFLVPAEFSSSHYDFFYVLINQLSRFAVPFFFVISGYFWGRGADASQRYLGFAWQRSKQLVFLLFVWSIVYLAPYNLWGFVDVGVLGPLKLAYWNDLEVFKHPLYLLLSGTKVHLWFLVALISATLVCGIFLEMGWRKCLPVAAVGLYVIGVLAKAYKATPWGIHLPFDSVFGPFFSTLLFVTGYWLSRCELRSDWFTYGLVLYLVGVLLHGSEIWYLQQQYGTPPIHDYVFGTYFMGVGVAMMALAKPTQFRFKLLPTIGSYTLGVYLSHFIFVDIFSSLNKQLNNIVWEIGLVLLVYACSLGLTILLMKSRYTKKMVVLSH